MIYVFAAIECEVSPLRYLESDDLKIILTGIGKVNAAFSVGRTFPAGLTRNDLKDDVIVNIGICGAKDLNGLFLVNKITDEAAGKDYYPDMIRVTGFPEAPLITVDDTKTDPDDGFLYEMEASAIYQAAGRLISPDRMAFIKIVSDSGDTGGITRKYVSDLVSDNLRGIEDIIGQIRNSLKDSSIRPDNGAVYEKLHATASMRTQIDELISFASSMGQDGVNLFMENAADVVSKKEGKEVITRVRSILTHLC